MAAKISTTPQEPLHTDVHVQYIQSLDSRTDEYESCLTEHLRLSGVYWGVTALHLLRRPSVLPPEKLIELTMQCWDSESGGFAAAPGHDAHLLYTCSAIQILAMSDGLDVLDELLEEGDGARKTRKAKVGEFLAARQDRKTGAFYGDQYGEADTRFVYAALNALSLLKLVHLIDVNLAVSYIEACANSDGGFGMVPGAESHAAQIFVCLGALSITGHLESKILAHPARATRLASWLSERQISSGAGAGGLNGRPEKKEDACYSWWVVSSLAMLGRVHWIDKRALRSFILTCQDGENGGFSDRPGNVVDVFHTCFGIAGLSLLEWNGKMDAEGDEVADRVLEEVDPVYCLPRKITAKLLGR